MSRTSSTGSLVSATRSSKAPSKPPRMLPSMSITEKDLPAIKTWTVGKKYALSIEVEMVGHSKGEYSFEGEPKLHEARLRITGIHAGK